MDRKSVIILVISFALLLAWFPLINHFYPPPPPPAPGEEPVVETTSTTSPGEAAIQAAPERAARPSMPKGEETLLVLENDDARYTFTSHGGGLKLVELKAYPAYIECGENAAASKTNFARLNGRVTAPVLDLQGPAAALGDGVFTLTQTGAGSVRAVAEAPGGLTIVKDFELGTNFTFTASLAFSNRTDKPLDLPAHELVIGTAAPAGPKDDPNLMGVIVYNGAKAEHTEAPWFDNRSLGCGPKNPRTLFESEETAVHWAGVHSQFFALVALPREPAGGLKARRIELLPAATNAVPVNGAADATTHGFQNVFPYRAAVIEPHGSVQRAFDFYAGPKEYQTLAKLGAQQQNNLDLVMDLDGFLGFFSKLLLVAMNALHEKGVSYGWAIVIITIAIKILFWPLTKASTKSMKRMAALQPQMKALQDKYKHEPQKMNQKLMEFMRENKVNPLGGCLPVLVQMPVFFGFFFMIRTAIELRGAEFLWICDLSTPDTVFVIPGIGFPINPMPILMGVTMLIQTRLTPMAPGMDPVQANMMRYMPLMFLVFLYNFSSGLTLYWTVQNILSIVQTKLTKTDPPAAAPGAPGAAPVPPKQHTPIVTSKKGRKRK
jgi:YidC/Oxa1 family membrane protein insertase